jgi:hypothetical protein
MDLERHTRYRITLVGVPGIEPGTSSLSGMRSNQLSYTPDTVPSSPGTPSAPASYRRVVEATGIEPVTSCLQSTRSTN